MEVKLAEDIKAIKDRMKEVEAAIAEVKGRLPAHSVKPPIMHQLLALEDEYDSLLEKLKALSASSDTSSSG